MVVDFPVPAGPTRTSTDRPEVAIAETAFHFELFMKATDEPPGNSDFRELVSGAEGRLLDLRVAAYEAILSPVEYAAGQALGRQVHAADGDGIVYPSVRWPKGEAAALFWPDRVVPPVTQARHLRYHWNGTRMDGYTAHDRGARTPWPPG